MLGKPVVAGPGFVYCTSSCISVVAYMVCKPQWNSEPIQILLLATAFEESAASGEWLQFVLFCS